MEYRLLSMYNHTVGRTASIVCHLESFASALNKKFNKFHYIEFHSAADKFTSVKGVTIGIFTVDGEGRGIGNQSIQVFKSFR